MLTYALTFWVQCHRPRTGRGGRTSRKTPVASQIRNASSTPCASRTKTSPRLCSPGCPERRTSGHSSPAPVKALSWPRKTKEVNVLTVIVLDLTIVRGGFYREMNVLTVIVLDLTLVGGGGGFYRLTFSGWCLLSRIGPGGSRFQRMPVSSQSRSALSSPASRTKMCLL